jgi:hypothetical protein
MWILLLIAVNINSPNDIPAKVWLEFDTQESCEKSLSSLKVWLKFNSFKVQGQCTKNS